MMFFCLSQRVTSSQRLDESTVLDTHSSIVSLLLPSFSVSITNAMQSVLLTYSFIVFFSKVDSEPYWYYEYLVRKSPTKAVSLLVYQKISANEQLGYSKPSIFVNSG